MTFGNLMSWGSFGKGPAAAPSIERYHSGSGGYWHHKSHGHGGHKHGGKGGGSSAALSALTLLAFLFLINVMQQSLQDNNSTMSMNAGTPAVLLREEKQQVSLSALPDTGRRQTKTSRQAEKPEISIKASKSDSSERNLDVNDAK